MYRCLQYIMHIFRHAYMNALQHIGKYASLFASTYIFMSIIFGGINQEKIQPTESHIHKKNFFLQKRSRHYDNVVRIDPRHHPKNRLEKKL